MAREPLFTNAFLRLWIFGFITFFSAFQLFPTIPFRIIQLGGSKWEAGLFLAVYTYASAFAAPLTGTIADHVGRKRFLLTASATFVVFSLLYGVITSLPLLLLVAVVHGAVWSGILSSGSAVTIDMVPESRRTEGIAYWGMSSTAAVAVAPTVGLAVFERYGWFALAATMTALSVVMFFLATLVRARHEPSTAPMPSVRTMFDWRVIAIAMTLFAVSFGYGGSTSYVALMSQERGIEPGSLFFNVFAVTILVMRVFTARLGDTHGPMVLLLPSLAVVPPALLVLAWADSMTAIIVAGVLFGLGFGGAYPGFIAYLIGRTDPQRRANTFGSVLWAFDTGIGTGSVACGFLVDHYGYTVAFVCCAVTSLAAIPYFLMMSRRLFPSGTATS